MANNIDLSQVEWDEPAKIDMSQVKWDDEKNNSPAFLPNENKVIAEQNARPDSVQNLKTELSTRWNPIEHPFKAGMQPTMIALKTLAVPFQRAESTVANVGMEAQKGNTNPSDYFNAAAKGISGERQAELGDLIRTTGFGGKLNEPIAKTVGFFGSFPVAGGVGKATEKTAQGISKGTNWLSKKTMSEYLRPRDKNLLYGKTPETVVADERIRAVNAQDLLKKLKSKQQEVGAQIGKSRAGNPIEIDINPAVSVIDNQISILEKDSPREMAGLINRLKDKKSDLLHEVLDKEGNLISSDDLTKVNLAKAHDFRDRSTSTATKSIFSVAPAQDDIYNETMRNVYREITKKMNDADSTLAPLNSRYGNLKSAIASLDHRINVTSKSTGIMGDALSGGMSALAGHAVGAAAGPVGVAGIAAHRLAQTAFFKTNISILLHDVASGAKSVQDLTRNLLSIPPNIKNDILKSSPSIRNKIEKLQKNPSGLTGGTDQPITSQFNPLNKVNTKGLVTPAVIGGALMFGGQAQAAEKATVGQEMQGQASTYGWGEKLNSHTFSGERFNADGVTVAMRGVPMGTKVEVTDPKTGNKIKATVNDGGPAKRLNRVVDLSRGAWKKLGYGKPGLVNVKVKILELGKGKSYNGKK